MCVCEQKEYERKTQDKNRINKMRKIKKTKEKKENIKRNSSNIIHAHIHHVQRRKMSLSTCMLYCTNEKKMSTNKIV